MLSSKLYMRFCLRVLVYFCKQPGETYFVIWYVQLISFKIFQTMRYNSHDISRKITSEVLITIGATWQLQ